MMKTKKSFFSGNKFLVILIILSVLMIAFGLWFNRQFAEADRDTTASPAEIPLPPLPAIDKSPPANLSNVQAALQSMSQGVIPDNHGLTQDDIIKAIAETTPGSETWCDLLLIKDENGWSEEEVQEFSRSCI
jgi:hypothetical protein